jgi:Zn finger protein HypA/HybF involved in hydrogenase expression
MNEDNYEFEQQKPYWFCESCGYKNTTKAMPVNREAFYQKVHTKGSPKCPKCKSESFMPVGF